jgi:hypothetical protein
MFFSRLAECASVEWRMLVDYWYVWMVICVVGFFVSLHKAKRR